MTNIQFPSKARILGAALLGALAAGGLQSAQAADLRGSIKDAPVYQEPERRFSWTGLYLGANLGGAWATGDARFTDTFGSLVTGSLDSSSVIGGGQIGYNWQAGQLVVGLEADIAAQNLASSGSTVGNAVTVSREGRWIGTVRPRIGYATGNALIYATGGLAYGNVEHTVTENRFGGTRSTAESSTRVGWTVGAGIEWALNRNWTIGAEYLHIDLGSSTVNAAASGPFPAASTRFEDREDVIRAKLNYKF